MGRTGRPKATLVLTNAERTELERIARRRKTAQDLALRARIVLLCSGRQFNKDVAKELGIARATVTKWRSRFIDKRLDGLCDEPRPGGPRKITDTDVEKVVVKTLESTPKACTHWSTRSMAKEMGLSHSSVGRIWRAFGLQPHKTEIFRLSNDPFFIDKVRDIVGLYMTPPDHAMVLCVDEKSQIQALERAQPLLPLRPGQPERRSHTYKRHGTTSLFAALDIATGTVVGKCYRRHRAKEFQKFLNMIDKSVPPELDVHLIVDNLSTHKTPAIQRWFARRKRFHIHFTPTYSSWLNLVERWFAMLTDKQLRRGSHRSTAEVEQAIYQFIEAHNDEPKPFVWTKSADQILDSIARYCQRTLGDRGIKQT